MIWFGFTLMGLIFTMRYANKIKLKPLYSFSYHSDAYFRENQSKASLDSRFNLGDILVLVTIIATIVWVIWGVVSQAWFIPEIASQFFTMGVVIGIIGVIFKLNGMTVNDVATSFKQELPICLSPVF